MLEQIQFYLNLCFISSLILSCLFIFPLTDLTIALYYKDNLICLNDKPLISIDNWLIVKGTFSLFTIALLLSCTILSGKDSLVSCFSKQITFYFNSFTLIWTIFGSYIYWGQCGHLLPESVNIYLWFSLIFSYILIMNVYNYDKERRNTTKKPLLDIDI